MATCDPWAQLKILEVQRVDSALDQLHHRLQKLPEAQTLSQLQSEIVNLKLREVAGITEVADRELEVRKAENDVDVVRLRASKDQNMLDSGQVSDAKALTELQHEVESLARRQAELEDEEMEILQKLEDAQGSLTAVRAELANAESQLVVAQNAHTVVVAEIEAERARLQTERAELVKDLPAELMKLYDKLRADSGAIAAARLYQGRCDGCRMQINPVTLASYRAAPSNELLRCEECRAILVRTAESGL